MYAQSVIQVRIDKPLKEEVGEIFSSIGLDMSTAIRMFFQRCRAVKGIPFALTAVSETTAVRMGLSKGKWEMSDDWHEQEHMLDREIEADFHRRICPIPEYGQKIAINGDIFADDSALWENS